ncbi:unnamed protein product [Brachionus calyciflorus]|uniref:TGF-beta family profile domain-containing protein n=1 Tax=Brachionus calyciflorus TaxID=104777 RepID=A0A813MDX6_9BILA|nr:unnamed protein product [Brachionus calyciflorus]
MNLFLMSLFNLALIINGEYGTYFEHYKNYPDSDIPSLKSLFNHTSYRDKTNKSSPCLHNDKKRDVFCEPVSYFDADGYERSLQETRNLILSRLNLDQEPVITLNKNTHSFLDQLENKILNDDKSSMVKTKYDVKTPQNKIFNSMHEATLISSKCGKSKYSQGSGLCVTFKIPVKNILSNNLIQRKVTTVVLWLYIRTASSYDSNIDENFHLEISNLKKSEIAPEIHDGWNTIDISNILKSSLKDAKQEYLEFTIRLKCYYECTIDSTDRDLAKEFYDDSVNILINNFPGKKPLLSINIEESDEMEKKRSKRRAGHVPYGINYRAPGIESHYQSKFCRQNSPEKDRECCLNRYFVDFNRLKWSNWIISPNGYTANYCSGRCNDPRSFNYGNGNINSEIKQKLNERTKSKDYFEANEILETCCHPISMESLVITYMANNGSVVHAVIPNMIITGCGCS